MKDIVTLITNVKIIFTVDQTIVQLHLDMAMMSIVALVMVIQAVVLLKTHVKKMEEIATVMMIVRKVSCVV